MWGSGATSVYAVGVEGTILHYGGLKWTPMTSGAGGTVTALWGDGQGTMFAVGRKGTILHRCGN